MNILENLSSENAHVEAIREQLFNVVTLPLYPPARTIIGREFEVTKNAKFQPPNNFGNWKGSGGECLGVLGKDFRATQPSMLLDAFSQCLIDSGIDLKSLYYQEVNGGRRVRFGVDLKPVVFKNEAKVGDVVKTSLVLQTGYDGYTATTFQLETEVLKCTNGMVGRGTTSKVSFKNTKGNVGKIAIACTDISQMVESANDFGQLIRAYDKTAITSKDVDKFLISTLGIDRKERENLHKTKLDRLNQFEKALDKELSRNGNTAWGLLNAMTFATNHLWVEEDAKLDYLTHGAGLRTNDKAQKFLNELVLAQ